MFLITLVDKFIIHVIGHGSEYIYLDMWLRRRPALFLFKINISEKNEEVFQRYFFEFFFFYFFTLLTEPYCYFMSFKFEHNSSSNCVVFRIVSKAKKKKKEKKLIK